MSAFSLPLLFCKRSYSSVRNDYGVQALAPTITLEFYLMSFHFIQKENLIQENKALSLRLKIIII